jgi:Na+-driven multidrug efflux pump
VIFLPLGFLLTRVFNLGVAGAWTAATVNTVLIGIIFFRRFVGEKWKDIDIFRGRVAVSGKSTAGG